VVGSSIYIECNLVFRVAVAELRTLPQFLLTFRSFNPAFNDAHVLGNVGDLIDVVLNLEAQFVAQCFDRSAFAQFLLALLHELLLDKECLDCERASAAGADLKK